MAATKALRSRTDHVQTNKRKHDPIQSRRIRIETGAAGHHGLYDLHAFAIYFVIWWVTLFLTLPFGIRSQHEDGTGAAGTDPGAPIASRMGRRMLWTTVLSAVIFALAMLAYNAGYLSVERLSKLMGMPF